MYNSHNAWGTVFKVTRWLMLTALLLTILPILLVLALVVFILVPKGRTWSTYWGSTLASGTRAAWHWVFGPPKVRIHHPMFRSRHARRRWPAGIWRN